MAKSNYYSLTKILSTKPDIALIVGQRGNGKTYACCKYFLEKYKKTKRRFCYVRRWVDDIKGFRAEQLFTPLQSVVEELWGKGYSVLYYRHKFYLLNPQGVKVDIMGYCLALSEAAHTKSVAFTDVGYILFDEFIQMSGEAVLRDEMAKFENTLSTIIRDKTDVLVLLCANTVSKFSPYFVHYGIDINKVKQGDIITKEYPLDDDKQSILRVSLEYCEYNETIGKKSSKYTTSKMITKGQWEIPPTDDIPSTEGEVVKERLLFSMYDPEAEVTVGCFLRIGKWVTIEQDPQLLLYTHKSHVREFLVLRQIDRQSSYFHLSDQKSLDYHTYNDCDYMLKDIEEGTGIDFEHELFMGRVFCDNMFTADYFNHCWQLYNRVTTRDML